MKNLKYILIILTLVIVIFGIFSVLKNKDSNLINYYEHPGLLTMKVCSYDLFTDGSFKYSHNEDKEGKLSKEKLKEVKNLIKDLKKEIKNVEYKEPKDLDSIGSGVGYTKFEIDKKTYYMSGFKNRDNIDKILSQIKDIISKAE